MTGVRNTLGDLHNMLMEQMERLADADGDQLDHEIERSRAMADVASQITGNAKVMITVVDKAAMAGVKPPRTLTDGASDEA